MPLIIISAAGEAFVNPLIYFITTYNYHDLNSEYAKSFVLCNLNWSFVLIWEEFLLMATYGVISPLALVAIGISAVSQINIVRCSLIRYFNLQFPRGKSLEVDPKEYQNEDHIEWIVAKSQENFESMLWPGMCTSCFIFSLYIVDTTLDTYHDVADAPINALVLFIFTILVVPVSYFIFHFYRNRVREKLKNKLKEQELMNSAWSSIPDTHNHEVNRGNKNTHSSKVSSVASNEGSRAPDRNADIENPIHSSPDHKVLEKLSRSDSDRS